MPADSFVSLVRCESRISSGRVFPIKKRHAALDGLWRNSLFLIELRSDLKLSRSIGSKRCLRSDSATLVQLNIFEVRSSRCFCFVEPFFIPIQTDFWCSGKLGECGVPKIRFTVPPVLLLVIRTARLVDRKIRSMADDYRSSSLVLGTRTRKTGGFVFRTTFLRDVLCGTAENRLTKVSAEQWRCAIIAQASGPFCSRARGIKSRLPIILASQTKRIGVEPEFTTPLK